MDNIMLKILLLLLFHNIQLNSSQIIRDTRCFLEHGATAFHLFVSEDKKIGDTVGVLGVLGDPGVDGDIELRLQERDSPVTIIPHSRNLTLIRPLDKEGIDGPASVYINIICERRRTLDPGFVIPVNIRVTDANDNAPVFVNAPYILNISEVTVVGTRVLQGVRALDADQPGPHSTVQYAVLPGPHSDYFVFINALEGTLVLRKPLDYETLNNFSVSIRAQDQGNPPQSTVTTLSVNVIDADDQNPIFLHDQYRIVIPDDSRNKLLRIEPEPIEAKDQDLGINAPIKYTIQGGILPFLNLNSQTAEITLSRPLMNHELTTPITMVIKATQIDNPDKYSLATVMVTRSNNMDIITPDTNGELPVKFVLKEFHVSVLENIPAGSIILTTGVNKIDSKLKFWLEGPPEELEKFSITNTGELVLRQTLDYEKKIQHSFFVYTTDGTNNDTARVNISVEDVNEWEPRFRHPRYEFHARTLRTGSIVGRLEAADGDRGDRVSLSLRGPDARMFEIRDNGELILTSQGPFNGTMARLVAVASDTGKPPRTSMIPLIVHIPNGNRSPPLAARAASAWLNGSILLVAVFGIVLGLLGVVILILILYIYKQKRPKNDGSVNSIGTGYRGKSPVPSALNSTPRVLGASIINEETPKTTTRKSRVAPKNVNNPVFGEENENPYNSATMNVTETSKSGGIISTYGRRKVAPMVVTPSLSATSNIPNIGGLVQNMNDLSARMNFDTLSQNSSNFSVDPPDSLIPVWPADDSSRHVKKLSWNDDSRTGDSVVDAVGAETRAGNSHPGPEKLNLTVYF